MSFGFSIGDIVLLSQLAYKLYSSISSGRKAASRDLKELGDALFSLRCALEHLGDAANEILATAESRNRQGGAPFKEKLDHIIESCGKSLHDLENVTAKYREAIVDEAADGIVEAKRDKKRRLQGLRVNWRKVRWDQEKQSLQQYRERLRSHTDAINIILNTVIWSSTNSAEASSKANHEKTHSLLEQVSKNSQMDTSIQKMIQEVHSLLTAPEAEISHIVHSGARSRSQIRPFGTLDASCKNPTLGASLAPPHTGPVALFSMAMPTIKANAPRKKFTVRRGVYAENLEGSLGNGCSQESAEITNSETDLERGSAPRDADIFGSEFSNKTYEYRVGAHSELPLLPTQRYRTTSLAALNNKRRAYGAKEYEAFMTRHQKPARPSFLTVTTPNVQDLHAGLIYIFRPLLGTGYNLATAQLKERLLEIPRWIEGFRHFVEGNGGKAETTKFVIDLMVALNEEMEKGTEKMKTTFYQAADQAGLMDTLNQVQKISKSVRVGKEVEEFQDAREEWDRR